MLVVIPGVGGAGTEAFREALGYPSLCLEPEAPPYSFQNVRRLLERTSTPEIVVIAFSAGVVGAVGALTKGWLQQAGLKVEALIALDGWLVPLVKSFPVYRLSHDRFTHQTSRPLGMGTTNFWADPQVPHRFLWSSPGAVKGWQVTGKTQVATTALDFLQDRLRAHGAPLD